MKDVLQNVLKFKGNIMSKKSSTTTAPKVSNYAKNRQARLLKHLKIHPNDRRATVALNENKTQSNRKAPNAKLGWMSTNKEVDSILRTKFVGTITKESLNIHAKILKLVKKSPFRLTPTLIKTEDGIGLGFKHLSKLSNFKQAA